MLRPGELAHVHFQDAPDMPREFMDNTTRLIPGDGYRRWYRFCGRWRRRATPGRFRSSCSCPSSSKPILMKSAKRIQEKSEAVMRKAKVTYA